MAYKARIVAEYETLDKAGKGYPVAAEGLCSSSANLPAKRPDPAPCPPAERPGP